ncbi:hypothetical protein Sjap_015098 [Stephania japonica]|uniref:RRM domain-containing protein n=1 Tax=Stephania japonica TaxID=461633 RepID=A0AAP0IIG8_9MAGN
MQEYHMMVELLSNFEILNQDIAGKASSRKSVAVNEEKEMMTPVFRVNLEKQYFGKYGEITDSMIMKDRYTGQLRGFGFVTYADPSVVDKVIEENHVFNGKQVEIKRTIPKGSVLLVMVLVGIAILMEVLVVVILVLRIGLQVSEVGLVGTDGTVEVVSLVRVMGALAAVA